MKVLIKVPYLIEVISQMVLTLGPKVLKSELPWQKLTTDIKEIKYHKLKKKILSVKNKTH